LEPLQSRDLALLHTYHTVQFRKSRVCFPASEVFLQRRASTRACVHDVLVRKSKEREGRSSMSDRWVRCPNGLIFPAIRTATSLTPLELYFAPRTSVVRGQWHAHPVRTLSVQCHGDDVLSSKDCSRSIQHVLWSKVEATCRLLMCPLFLVRLSATLPCVHVYRMHGPH
jgi:hypothetical protein